MTSAHGWREKDAAQPCPRVQASPCVYAGWRTCMQAHHPLFFPLLPSSTLLSPLSSMLHPHTPILCHIRSIRLFPLSAPILVILGTNEDSKSESCSARSLSLSFSLTFSVYRYCFFFSVSDCESAASAAASRSFPFPSSLTHAHSVLHTACFFSHSYFRPRLRLLPFSFATLSSSRFSL